MAELFREVLHDPPHMNIGKNGITANVVTHILELLKTKKILKIKILKETAHLLGIDTVITQLQQQCRIVILDVRGFTIIIAKKYIPGIQSPKKYNPVSEPNLISSQQIGFESSVIEEIPELSENLDSSIKAKSNSMPDESSRVDHIEPTSQHTQLQLNPDYIDYDDPELMTELNHIEESVQTTRRSTRKDTRPRSPSVQRKKMSKKTAKKSRLSTKTHM